MLGVRMESRKYPTSFGKRYHGLKKLGSNEFPKVHLRLTNRYQGRAYFLRPWGSRSFCGTLVSRKKTLLR